jgi:hypothetical protein
MHVRLQTIQTSKSPGPGGSPNLTEEEVAQARGGQNQTFAFTHIISDDVTHD